MTGLLAGQTITRETDETERARPLVVRLHAKYLEIWPKGKRACFRLSYDVIFDVARKRAASFPQLWTAGVDRLAPRRKGGR